MHSYFCPFGSPLRSPDFLCGFIYFCLIYIYFNRITFFLSLFFLILRVSFDFEDFHRGEYKVGDVQSQKVKKIEDKYVPLLDFATCASPLIEDEYKKLYPYVKITTINNCFPFHYKDKSQRVNIDEDIKLFWFSQNIGTGRGVEDIIRAIGLVNDKRIKLTLLGNSTDDIKKYFIDISIRTRNSYFTT